MKPKTRIQSEIVALSKRLKSISEKQKAYAYKYCFSHIGRMTSKGIVTCTDCGYSWKGENTLPQTTRNVLVLIVEANWS